MEVRVILGTYDEARCEIMYFLPPGAMLGGLAGDVLDGETERDAVRRLLAERLGDLYEPLDLQRGMVHSLKAPGYYLTHVHYTPDRMRALRKSGLLTTYVARAAIDRPMGDFEGPDAHFALVRAFREYSAHLPADWNEEDIEEPDWETW